LVGHALRECGQPLHVGAALLAVNADVIAHLVCVGLIELDKAALTERVIAETSIDMPIAEGYRAPVCAAPMPTDLSDTSELDPNVWRPIWEVFEEIIESRKTPTSSAAPSVGVRAGYRSGSAKGMFDN